jgi:hypothetical protein
LSAKWGENYRSEAEKNERVTSGFSEESDVVIEFLKSLADAKNVISGWCCKEINEKKCYKPKEIERWLQSTSGRIRGKSNLCKRVMRVL